jgi:hypothetical protein
MWICQKCNEKIEDEFDTCWNCLKHKDEPFNKEEDALNKAKEEELERIKKEKESKQLKGLSLRQYCLIIFLSILFFVPEFREFLFNIAGTESFISGVVGFFILSVILIILKKIFKYK